MLNGVDNVAGKNEVNGRLRKDPVVMSNEEIQIYELLKRFSNRYVSVTDVSKSVGTRKDFNRDRLWAQPVLRRMEMQGLIEANPYGDYRIKHQPDETTTFKNALETPGVPLGDTTIISLSDVQDDRAGVV
jgi:hypothetical protein